MRVLLLTLVARAALGSRLAIDFSTDEAFSITIDGTPWLHGGGASLGGRVLRPSGPWRQIKGKDARGTYKGRARRYGCRARRCGHPATVSLRARRPAARACSLCDVVSCEIIQVGGVADL